MLLAGLDIETTGLYSDRNHKIIQVGLAIRRADVDKIDKYTMDVCPVGDLLISSRSLEINKFTLDRIGVADTTTTVDAWFDRQLRKDGYKHDTLIPVGWNVIGFDGVFIQKEMPLLAKYFTFANDTHSTRAIDLTSLGLLVEYKTGTPYSEIKRALREQAAVKLGRNNEHDALYDAEAALMDLDHFYNLLS